MLHFVTLFDINYLSRGIALYTSLLKHTKAGIKLYVVALDEVVGVEIKKIINDESLILIQLQDLEISYPELVQAKNSRSTIEYYFTLSPFLPTYILQQYPNVDRITSLDADLYFYNDPQLIFDQYPNSEILITPHNFPPDLTHLEKYGKYNVSFQSFKRTPNALACLEKWRRDCLDFCSDEYDEVNNRFADQKYLDDWQEHFENVNVIDLPNSGLAPWNISKYQIEAKNWKIIVDGLPLIFYHFHHLRFLNRVQISHGLGNYKASKVLSNRVVKLLYKKYILQLLNFNYAATNQVLRYKITQEKYIWNKILQSEPYWVFIRPFFFHIDVNNKIILFSYFLKNRVRIIREALNKFLLT